MVCPLCKTEARIERATNVMKGGKLYRKIVYTCRNKKCENFDKEVGTQLIELPFEKEDADEGATE